MPTGISGLYKGTRGDIAHKKSMVAAAAKKVAKSWKCSFKKAEEICLKRLERGVDPLTGKAKKSKVAPAKKSVVAKNPKKKSKIELFDDAMKNMGFKKLGVIEVKPGKPFSVGEIEEYFKRAGKAIDGAMADEAKESKESGLKAIVEDAKALEKKFVAGGHYDFEKPVTQAIELIEMVAERENIPRKAAHNICECVRYLMRVGVKTPDWRLDVAKAENYLHRALNGCWIEKA